MPKKLFFATRQAAIFLGIDPCTLRRWDAKKVFCPEHIAGKHHRRYSQTQLETKRNELWQYNLIEIEVDPLLDQPTTKPCFVNYFEFWPYKNVVFPEGGLALKAPVTSEPCNVRAASTGLVLQWYKYPKMPARDYPRVKIIAAYLQRATIQTKRGQQILPNRDSIIFIIDLT